MTQPTPTPSDIVGQLIAAHQQKQAEAERNRQQDLELKRADFIAHCQQWIGDLWSVLNPDVNGIEHYHDNGDRFRIPITFEGVNGTISNSYNCPTVTLRLPKLDNPDCDYWHTRRKMSSKFDPAQWGEFFADVRQAKAEYEIAAREGAEEKARREIENFKWRIINSSNEDETLQDAREAKAAYPDEPYWEAMAEARIGVLQQIAQRIREDKLLQAGLEQQQENEYRAAHLSAEARARAAWFPFTIWRLQYIARTPDGGEAQEEPFYVDYAYSLAPYPDDDGWWPTVSCGEARNMQFPNLLSVSEINLTNPEDPHAAKVCASDYDHGIYIHTPPPGVIRIESDAQPVTLTAEVLD